MSTWHAHATHFLWILDTDTHRLINSDTTHRDPRGDTAR
jgi:hypothetical protein